MITEQKIIEQKNKKDPLGEKLERAVTIPGIIFILAFVLMFVSLFLRIEFLITLSLSAFIFFLGITLLIMGYFGIFKKVTISFVMTIFISLFGWLIALILRKPLKVEMYSRSRALSLITGIIESVLGLFFLLVGLFSFLSLL